MWGSLRSPIMRTYVSGCVRADAYNLILTHAVITRSNLAVSDIYMSVFGKDATDSLYLLLCRYIRSQVTHRYISRSAASYEEPISSYSLELK